MFKKMLAGLLSLVAAASFAAVDINTATVADLDSIKGIGPNTSSRILKERKTAPFKNWGDLIQRVPGIGEKRAAQLSTEGLTVNGEAFKPARSGASDKSTAKQHEDKKPASAIKPPSNITQK
jgi:competence protein ComEA